MDRRRVGTVVVVALVAFGLGVAAPTAPAAADGNEASGAPAAARALSAGASHSCAIADTGQVRCWGEGANGQLGFGTTDSVGDDETPASVAPVDLGVGRTAIAVSAATSHSCAVLDDGSVRCWGVGANGRLGYGTTADVGDDEAPGAVGPVNLGAGRTALAVTAGDAHTCALLDDGSVRCWGVGANGRLGYANTTTIGDDEAPGSVGPVNLGAGRTAVAITAGDAHTCALLDDGTVRCWGLGTLGRLGYAGIASVGDDEVPGSVGPVALGAGRTAVALSAGGSHTCAVLDDGSVRCWGNGGNGRLGYADTTTIGDNEAPGSVGPVDLGAGRTAVAVSAGAAHTCAVLDDATVRCWGDGGNGRLGYADTSDIGDDETPGSMSPVDLGAGRSAESVTAGGAHTCAVLDDGTLRCWGQGNAGQLGYADTTDVGDDEAPGSVGPIALVPEVTGLSVTAAADEGSVMVGATIHLHVTVTNTGNVALTNVTVSAPDAPGCEVAPFALAGGAGQTVDCTRVAVDGDAPVLSSTASVTADQVTTPVVSDPVEVHVTPQPKLAAGGNHSCAVLGDGSVRCWGLAFYGQLGYADINDVGDDELPGSVGPVNIGSGRTAVAVATGDAHSCALLDDGSVRCWGYGVDGRLGSGLGAIVGDNEPPGVIPAVTFGVGRTAVALAAGGQHTCALLDDGTVRCWGLGADGRLGYGNTNTRGTPGPDPVDLGAGRTAVAITAGDTHTCALLDDGTVRCWGLGADGRLGYGNTSTIGDDEVPGSVGPVSLGAGRTAVAIDAGGKHTCAVLDDASVRCWGRGEFGQLGYGNQASVGDDEAPASVGPVNFGAGRTAVSVTAGGAHSCVVMDNGGARCWGYGIDGRLGTGFASYGDVQPPAFQPPLDLGGGHTALAVTTGDAHTCARLDDGSVRCWGKGQYGRLGYASQVNIPSPGLVGPVFLDSMPVLSVVASADEGAVTEGATIHLHVTVSNTGSLAATGVTVTDANAPGCEVAPFTVPAGGQVTVDCTHTAVAGDAPVFRNSASVVSTEVTTPVTSNSVAVAVAPVTRLSAGGAHSCAIVDGGTVRCWGIGVYGRLGYGNTATIGDDETPGAVGTVDLGPGRTAVSISAGYEHTCALLDDATVRCWGRNQAGQLGYASTSNVGDDETPGSMGPVNLGAGRTAAAITAGHEHTCALLDDGTVRCWGNGANGRSGYANTSTIGDDETPGSVGPVNLGAGRTAAAITAGVAHTCAVLDDGSVRCWGLGDDGRLGYGNTASIGDNETPGSAGPVSLGTGQTAVAVAAGDKHTCALLDDGTVRCWGNGGNGRLGYGNTSPIGDDETPGSAGPVNLGAGRTAVSVTTRYEHTCVLLDDSTVRCWGRGLFGRLGYANQADIGDTELPGSVGPVDLGAGRTVLAVSAGDEHNCARLDDDSVRCWGRNTLGQLGYADTSDVGDDETPAVAGPVSFAPVPALSIAAAVDETQVRVGATVHLHVTVTNTGTQPLTGVTISVEHAPSCAVTPFTLAVGEDRTVDCTATIAAGDVPMFRSSAAVVSAEVTTPVVSDRLAVAVATPPTLAVADAHSCAIVTGGAVRCWGLGTDGRLGYGNTASIGDNETPGSVGPVNLGAGRTAVAIAAGGSHTCALLDNGSVRCWGLGSYGQLGYGNTASVGDNEAPGSVGPVNLGAGRTAVAIAAGVNHTCAVLDDGSVRCWGRGAFGRLGYASSADVGDNEAPGSVGPVNLGAGRTAVAVAAGASHTCALLDDGSVRCWGFGNAGRLGYGNTADVGDNETPGSVGPVDVGAGRRVLAVSAGREHTCALLDDETVRCWGSGSDGRLGYGTTADIGDDETPGSVGPLDLGTVHTPVSLSAGTATTCAVLDDGSLRCWGPSPFAVPLGPVRTAVEVAAADLHFCVRLDDATVRCWGSGSNGRLGYANTSSVAGPSSVGAVVLEPSALTVVGSADEKVVAAGVAMHLHLTITNVGSVALTNVTITDLGAPDCVVAPFSLAVGAHRDIACTRTATNADVPSFTHTASVASTEVTTPVVADPVSVRVAPTTAVSTGAAHSCAVDAGGRVRCWGNGTFGQLGYGDTATIGDDETAGSAGPVDLGAGATAVSVAAGARHTCALLDDGTVRCWGYGAFGALGYASTATVGDDEVPGSVGPVNLGAGRTAAALTAGGDDTCAVLDNGTVRCWGFGGDGRLGSGVPVFSIGDDETPGSQPPVNLGAGRTAVAISAGYEHTCALLDDGTVRCWGQHGGGRLGVPGVSGNIGDDEPITSVGTVDLGAGRTATAVDAGYEHTCALLDDGSIRCWGRSQFGQLGYASTLTIGDDEVPGSIGPVDLGTGRTAVAVAAGVSHTCARLDDGTVRCWGYGPSGALGYAGTAHVGDDEAPGSVGPVDLGAGRTATEVSAGDSATCARLDDGAIRCWGTGSDGRLGLGNTATIGDDEVPGSVDPIDFSGLSVVASADETAVVSGDTVHLHVTVTNTGNAALTGVTISSVDAPDCAVAPFALAVGADQTVDCTHTTTVGDVPAYRFSVSVVSAEVTTPVTSNEVEVAVRPATASELVTAGGTHSCAILPTGHVKCWGFGLNGRLGQGSTADLGDEPGEMAALAPVDLGAGRTATAISAGSAHTCALLDDGTVKCWGRNLNGQLGQGSTADLGDQPGEMAALAPVDLGAGRTATAISAGASHTCAVLDDGSVKCWGSNASGQLGQGSTATLGDEPGEMAALAPVDLGAGRTAVTISAGELHTCALLDDATVKCWGSGANGRLGQDSSATLGDEPGEMAALAPVSLGAGRLGTAVDAGFTHTCAMLDDASVKCWGTGDNGRLGQDSTASLGDEPGEMAALPPVDLALRPSGVAGTITEVGSGAPLGGVWVAALRTSDFSIATGAVADGSGAFAADLAPGTYFLYLIDPTGAHPAGFFGAPTLITVTAGTVVPANPTMTALRGSVTATVTETGSGDPLAGVWGLALAGSGNTGATESIVDADGSGHVSLTGLGPGNHFVGFIDPTGAHETRFFPDSPNVPDATMVAVTAGNASVADVALPPQVPVGTGAVISGTVTEEGTGAPIASARVVALRAADYQMVRGATSDGSGHYVLDLAPGQYKLAVLDGAGGHEMEWFDDLGSTELGSAVSVTAPGTADAALASSRGAVSGTITDDPSGDPLEGAWVIAIGPSGIAGGSVTAADGSYRVDGLAPGTYRVTVADPNGGRRQEFYDDALDFGGAVPLSVLAGGTVTVDAALAPP